jgi:hypothetical protein
LAREACPCFTGLFQRASDYSTGDWPVKSPVYYSTGPWPVKSSRYFTGLLSVFQRFSVSAFDLLISLAREVFSLLHRAAFRISDLIY